MKSINHNLESLKERIARAAVAADRRAGDICLIAVSKTRTIAEVQQAYDAGIRDFGENYLQDALPKIAALRDLPDIRWHFIGALQSNKTRDVAANFDWLHTLDRLKISRRLNEQREGQTPLQVCIQVNIDAQPQKGGVDTSTVASFLEDLKPFDNLQVRGLMAIPDPNQGDASFLKLAKLGAANQCKVLSMGMSGDFENAIRLGATHVRIGTAIFGPRN